jgi:hypothetical protein
MALQAPDRVQAWRESPAKGSPVRSAYAAAVFRWS